MLEAMHQEIAAMRMEMPDEKGLDNQNSEDGCDAEERRMEADAIAAHEPANPVDDEEN